ncbi:hypothetical protein ABZY09_44770 [Streptomyces sp. NPDC002928]|uniref:hypothetical protein n=1 Tax=Streptomyces sp. NPDC002928 TaxID=3154440 RepID=UPI00339FBDA4
MSVDKTRHEDPSAPSAPSRQPPTGPERKAAALRSSRLPRRIRDRAALGIVHGMGTAVGGLVITSTITWLQTH